MTLAEYDKRRRVHEDTLQRVANAVASEDDLEPLIRLFRD